MVDQVMLMGWKTATRELLPVRTDENGAIIFRPTSGVSIAALGRAISFTGTSSSEGIPNTSTGEAPEQVRLAATAACYVRLGGGDAEASAVVATPGTGYVKADTIVVDGGVADTPMTLTVATTKLASAVLNAAGTGYVPADTITLAGGTAATKAILTVATTKVVSAAVAAGGASGTPGAATVTGTTGTGTKFQAAVTIGAGGNITAVNSISVVGAYTVNPVSIAAEPVTGGSLVGATLTVVMGVATFTISEAGNYTVNSAAFTQFATSGAGVGATFQTGLFGARTVTVTEPGDYQTNPSNPAAQASTSGAGTGAAFTLTWATAAQAGDLLVQPGDSIIVDALGFNEVAAIQVTGAGVLVISPLENVPPP